MIQRKMSKLQIRYTDDGDVVKEVLEGVGYVDVLCNDKKIAVDGKVYCNVVQVTFFDS